MDRGPRCVGGRTSDAFSLNFVKELKPRPITRDLDWGVPIPVAGYDELRRQADLRVVRRGHRVPLGVRSSGRRTVAPPMRGASGGRTRRRAHVLHGQGQHRLPHRDLAEHAARVRTTAGRTVQDAAPSRLPDNVASSEFLTMEGKKFSSSRGVQILVRDFLSRYDARCASLLPHDRRPRDSGHGLHVGRVRAAQQRRARRDVGQSRQSDAPERVQELRRRSDAGIARPRTTRHCSHEVESGFDSVGASDRGRALPERAPGGDAARRRSATNTSPSRRRGRSWSSTASAPATILYVALARR